MRAETLDIDFLVLGGGMAGMTAASFAASAGCSVLVVEKNPEIGGSAVLSGGKLWTGKSYDDLDSETPGGEPALKRAALDNFERAVAWVRQSGAHVAPPTPHLHYGRGYDLDIHGYIAWCAAAVTHAGGHVVRDAVADRLVLEKGAVVGAEIRGADGVTPVRARRTLLATGGFPAAPDLLARYVTPLGHKALARCNPANTGDGLKLGLAAGGALSPSMRGFYGHVMHAPVRSWGPREFRAYTQGNASVNGVLLNLRGRRFCDESLEDHRNAQRILEQPEARALIVFDRSVREAISKTRLANTQTATDAVQIAMNEGAHIVSADTWDAVFAQAHVWGFDSAAGLATLNAYNRFAIAGEGAIDPPRRRGLRAYVESPFFAIEGQAGVTATHGGLWVDAHGRVLNAQGKPVPGLHAAGADAGNMHGGGYGGGLNFAAVFGLLAADQAIAARL